MTVDIDISLIYALLTRPDKFGKFLEVSIEPAMLVNPVASAALNLIIDHFKKYEVLPHLETVATSCCINFSSSADEPIDYWVDQIRERNVYRVLQGGIAQATELMGQKKPIVALDKLDDIVKQGHRLNLSASHIVKLFDLGEQVAKYYEAVKNGEFGIITPWPTMNSRTMGWHQGEMALFAGRLKTGKTWIILNLALSAWRQGKKSLVVSAEMSQRSLAMRFYSLLCDLTYYRLRRGLLGPQEEKEFYDNVARFKAYDNIYLFGDNFKLSLPEIEAAIVEIKPDIVFLDSMYLMTIPGVPNRMDKAPIISNETKMMAKRHKIPIVGSMQLSRTAVGKKEGDLDASMVALSDSFAWDADYLFGMIRNKDMKEAKELMLKTLAIREGDDFELMLHWDFDRMNFGEKIKEEDKSKFNDAGFNMESKSNYTPYKDQEFEDKAGDMSWVADAPAYEPAADAKDAGSDMPQISQIPF